MSWYSTGQVILHISYLGIVQYRPFYTVHVLVEYRTGNFTQFMSWCSTGQVILHISCLGVVQDRSFYTFHVLV